MKRLASPGCPGILYTTRCGAGTCPYVKIGRRRLTTRQHLEQFLGVAS
jgi:hypothetical protein